jgi:hypothetical protein
MKGGDTVKKTALLIALFVLVGFLFCTFAAYAAMPAGWPADSKFVGIKADKTKGYHSVTGDCVAQLSKMKKDDLVFFKTKEDAEKAGYKACPMNCKCPPADPKKTK